MNKRPTVTLRQRPRKDGTSSLYLDVYAGSKAEIDKATGKLKYIPVRERKNLNMVIKSNPKNKKDRRERDETLRLADEIRREEELRLASTLIIEKEDISDLTDFYDYYQDYVDGYYKKDKRHLTRAIKLFKEYLLTTRKYRHFSKRMDISLVSRQMIEGYVTYLQSKFKGEGPHTVFARFKKVFKCAFDEGVITKNPCAGIKVSCSLGQLEKDTLTPDEIKRLIEVHYDKEKPEVRRAFLFCLHTGIRGCDVRHLHYSDICLDDRILRFKQRKTDGRSAECLVTLPLTDFHFNIIGNIPFDKNKLIFKLPSDTTCNQELKKWMKAAGIYKHITWHCARHSFGTNLCEADVNPMTIMRLMGHSHMKYTERYVRVRDKAKIEAMDLLCPLTL